MRLGHLLPAVAALLVSEPALAASPMTLAANPVRVCATKRLPAYLNVDMVLHNGSSESLEIDEFRGMVIDGSGAVVERRMVWQQARSLLGDALIVGPGDTSTIFNPFHFATLPPDASVRFEASFVGGKVAPVSVTIRPADCTSKVSLIMPVTGRVLVFDGADMLSHHRRGTYSDDWSREFGLTDNFQRYGLDLVVVDKAGLFFRGDGSKTSDWLGWGLPVRAAASGTVAAVHDGQPDNVVIGTVDMWTERVSKDNPMSSYCNYVLIDHGSGEFSLVAHLQNGSLRVKKGGLVKAGDRVASVGNSGASGGVHVHFERRTGGGIAGIETLPAAFVGVQLQGSGAILDDRPTVLDSGDIVIAD